MFDLAAQGLLLGRDKNKDLINEISGTDDPQYHAVDLDEGTKGLIQASVDRLKDPYKSSDIDKSASMFMPKGPSESQAASGLLSAPGAGAAIANKYAQIAGEKIQSLKSEQGRSDKEHEFARSGRAFNNVMVQQQVQNQNYAAYLEQIKNEQQVRAQTINTILGGGAMVGGAMAGSAYNKSSGGERPYRPGEGADTMQVTQPGNPPGYGNGMGQQGLSMGPMYS